MSDLVVFAFQDDGGAADDADNRAGNPPARLVLSGS